MDTDELYAKFEVWIDTDQVRYANMVGRRIKAFYAFGEAAEIIHKETSLHAVGFSHGKERSLLLTDELNDLFGQARVQALRNRSLGHGNDNEPMPQR